MKTRDKGLSSKGGAKAEEGESAMARFKRGATVVMTTSGAKVKAQEALNARRRLTAKAKRKDD